MGKGDTPRPLNLERYRENYERMFGRRCLKHRRTGCPECFPPAGASPLRGREPDLIVLDEVRDEKADYWDRLKDEDDRGRDED
jgi:hypothetical protein